MAFRKLFVSCVLVLMATQVQAATITATSIVGRVIGGFVVDFDDTNNDEVFSLSELTRFSGVRLGTGGGLNFASLLGVPAVNGISAKSGVSGPFPAWIFSAEGRPPEQVSPSFWRYEISGVNVPWPVPLPAAFPMLAAGAAAFGIAARLRTRRLAAV